MGEREEFGFCPKCGAVMQGGVCQSCGYTKKGAKEGTKKPEARRPVKDNRSGGTAGKVLACIGIIAGVLLIVLFVVFLGALTFGNVVSDQARSSIINDGFDRYYDYYNGGGYDSYDDYGSYEPYVPDSSDEFYQEITDATSLECSYQVIWQSQSLYPDDPDDGCTYDSVYPVVTGENDGRYAAVNARIRDMVCEYQDTYRDYESGVSSYAYVTYMDEETLSVVVQHRIYDDSSAIPEVKAVSFRMDTGEEIPKEQMITVDEELARQFRTRDSAQNGGVEFVEEASDEELIRLLNDEETSVMFYTPVGLEIGFNYDGGWVTVTIKNTIL